MNTTDEVDAWFAELNHPLETAMQRIREIILGADARMTEIVQYGTVQFVYASPMAGFVQLKDHKRVSLMFNAAGRLQGDFPHLEGSSVKYLRVSNLAQVEERAEELRRITAAWCAYKDQSGKARPAR